ncbi:MULTISPECIES: hypothetical protein [unclassified Fibrobacter]|uniref:hypothetical protein n=1 Tax=unclassified Fibrobacter TaxID=2634177 RepID=UPI000D6C3335|nr:MULTISPECIES: hypothetical protein [unclassified Fibrobacter]PWJ55632.1 hypothetical protein BGX12_1662 [Fibrobacter sp. UWR4]PZW61964.1 hypothetical protein C8E88_10672 [Fibrobacter sp. UWR1]
MQIKENSELSTIVLYTFFQSMVVGIFMAYIALNHNAQGQFVDLESGEIYYLNLAIVFGSWFVGNLFFCLAIFAIVFLTKKLWKLK